MAKAIDNPRVIAGLYKNVSLAYDPGKKAVSGVYEYYDRWDDQQKEYMNINVFYFFVHYGLTDTLVIKSGWPDDKQLVNGKIIFPDKGDSNYIEVFLDK